MHGAWAHLFGKDAGQFARGENALRHKGSILVDGNLSSRDYHFGVPRQFTVYSGLTVFGRLAERSVLKEIN
jgi:hypothetical protein